MKIFLDDTRHPSDSTWVWFDSAFRVIEALETLNVSEISLDNDLGNKELYGEGYDVLLWIEEKVFTNEAYVPPNIKIHTANPVARQKMYAAVASITKEIKRRLE